MSSFETYLDARRDHQDNPPGLEQLQSSFLQRAWAEMRTRESSRPEEENEEAIIEWITATGEWFRKSVLEHKSAPGEPNRKDHYLQLFDADPDAAVQELDQLFNAESH